MFFIIATAIARRGRVRTAGSAPWGIDFFHWLPYHMQGMVNDPELGYVHPRSVSYRLGAVNDPELARTAGRGDPMRSQASGASGSGDSVAFGWGVDQGETFSDRMEPLLRQRTGQPWQVINAGVNGYNSEQEAAFLEYRGWRYAPDIVLLVFVDNDVDPRVIPNERRGAGTRNGPHRSWTQSIGCARCPT
jgi:hypothetical protein